MTCNKKIDKKRMNEPSEKAKRIIMCYNYELKQQGKCGAAVRTAKWLGYSKNYIYYLIKRHSRFIDEPPKGIKKEPSEKIKRIIDYYNYELKQKKHGAGIRAAKWLGCTRQYIDQMIKKYKHLIEEPEEEIIYFTCKICELDFELKFKAKKRYGLCIYCEELKLQRCIGEKECNAIFPNLTGTKRVCNVCNVKTTRKAIDKIREQGGPRLDRLRKQLAESAMRWKKKKLNQN